MSVYKAFIEAKQIALHELKDVAVNFVTLPWVYDDVLMAETMLGNDYWSYGLAPNRAAIEAMARYSYTQGLSQRQLSAEELFHPSTLELSKV